MMQPQAASQSNSAIAYAQYQYQPTQAQVQVQGTPTLPQQLVAAQQPVAVEPTYQYSQQVTVMMLYRAFSPDVTAAMLVYS